MPFLIITVGTYFGAKLKFFYILHPLKTAKTVFSNSKGGFKSLSLALAGTLGVGNIAGVASAIIAGGAGAVFWMWVSAFAAMSIKYTEVVLAVKHRHEKSGRYYGGAPYYINEGRAKLTGKKASLVLSLIFAFLCIVNSLTTGNLVQINAVSSSAPFSPLFFGIVFTACVFAVICGGVKRISSFTFVLMPALTAFYIVISLYVIITDISRVPYAIDLIFRSAFSLKAAGGGIFGFALTRAIRYGANRGALSNEAGCGTSPAAHASSDTKNPHAQGCLGIVEVFTDTILLCTMSALVILLSGCRAENAMELVISSYSKYLGFIGEYGIIISSVLFALATVACQFFYGCEAVSYIADKKISKCAYTCVFVFVCLTSSLVSSSVMWQISDIVISTMTVFNTICLLLLFHEVCNNSYL